MPQFGPRPREQRKRKVRDRLRRRQPNDPNENDVLVSDFENGVESKFPEPNATIIIPSETNSVREAKRQKLKEELRAQQPKVSSKKQKRLDKYIENKLRKDESAEYLRLLEKDHAALGKRTFDEYVQGQFQDKAGVRDSRPKSANVSDSDEETSEDSSGDEVEQLAAPKAVTEILEKPPPSTGEAGSGLVKPMVIGLDGLPLVTRNKSHKRKRQKLEEHSDAEESWEGFSDGEEVVPEMSREEKEKLVMSLLEDESSYDDSNEQEDDEDNESDDDEVCEHADEGGNTSTAEEVSIDEAKKLIMNLMNQPPSDGEDDHTSGAEENLAGSANSDESSKVDGDDETEDISTASDTSLEEQARIKPRQSAFKLWATQQINQSLGHTPSYETATTNLTAHSTVPKPEILNPVLKDLLPAPASSRKAVSVHVQRSENVQQARSELPILQKEQEIMEAFHNHATVIVKGDTGSGKTTQIPQLLYEAGYGSPNGPTPGMIGITQPRRVAAVSMAKRVGDEMGDHGNRVAYQIRFDSNVSSKTAVKFMTDGILLRELSQDLLLRKYSVIVIDEAHERSTNTDILIGVLSKVVPARMRKNQFNPHPTPLKLIIMSATLNIGDFTNDRLFPPGSKPPVVEAEGRQHRVTTHFALRSRADYLDEVVEKVRRGHRKLPKGGILVFLTGQSEIRQAADRLRKALAPQEIRDGTEKDAHVRLAAKESPLEIEDMDIAHLTQDQAQDDFDHDIIAELEDEEEQDEFDISDDEGELTQNAVSPASSSARLLSREPYTSAHILALYSQLPTKQQLQVFEPPPENARLIVLATNVAETSLTIPGIRYVFDIGRSKQRKYNLDSGVQSFDIDYISKASAAQRTGRAGRTGPGHCWRLYSSAVYERFFPEHALPEILRTPAESIVLQLKNFAYPKPVLDFPFPSAPQPETLKKAESLLKNLGALTSSGSITDLGRELSLYPLSPRLGKIISQGIKAPEVLANILLLVSGLAVQEIFVQESQLDLAAQEQAQIDGDKLELEDDDEVGNKQKQNFGRTRATLSKHDKTSDALKLLTAVSSYTSATDQARFCRDYFLKPKAMFEVSQLHAQLVAVVRANNPVLHDALKSTPKLSSKNVQQLNSIAASGYIDQVAIRADLSPNPPQLSSKPRRSIDVPYLPLIPLSDDLSASLTDKAVFVHPSSVLSRLPPKDLPQYLTYSHLQRSQSHTIGVSSMAKTRMFPLTPISGPQLVQLSKDTALLEYGKPLPKTKVEDLPGSPRRRECWISTELRGGPGFGWPLPPIKVREVLDVKSRNGWRVEQILS